MLHLASGASSTRQSTLFSSTAVRPCSLVRTFRPSTLRAKAARQQPITAMASSIPLITLGKSVEVGNKISAFLAPKYKVQSIHSEVSQLLDGLNAAPEKPKGLLIGGGFTDEEAEEGTAVIRGWNPGGKVVRVTPGTLEKVGPAGVAGWIKEQLDAEDWS